ncbi:hypothetical protein L208DRAFT_1383557 [Tricholoma matsutake]|nr:hypothetical protein L208DRAFT_1383557 [Tricholoma matsutake 945]
MTRTARSSFPRAIVKDRSESKTGLDKSLRKNGAGMHNWGSLADEGYLESAALEDEEFDDNESTTDTISSQSDSLEDKKPTSNSTLTEEELETARKFRKNALKTIDLDLTTIARTSSAVSTSPKSVASIQARFLSPSFVKG